MIFAMPKTGSTPTVVASNAGSPSAIAVDATHVYWADYAPDTGTIRRVTRTGGDVETLASAQERPADLVIDGSSIYWITERGDGTGAIWKLPK
jgi:sugar lactone lactonase YvrE